jgi:hypothetical protein
MFVPVFGFGNGGFGWEEIIWEMRKPTNTTNGNARMQSAMSLLRFLVVMAAAELAKNLSASIIQMLTKLPELL